MQNSRKSKVPSLLRSNFSNRRCTKLSLTVAKFSRIFFAISPPRLSSHSTTYNSSFEISWSPLPPSAALPLMLSAASKKFLRASRFLSLMLAIVCWSRTKRKRASCSAAVSLRFSLTEPIFDFEFLRTSFLRGLGDGTAVFRRSLSGVKADRYSHPSAPSSSTLLSLRMCSMVLVESPMPKMPLTFKGSRQNASTNPFSSRVLSISNLNHSSTAFSTCQHSAAGTPLSRALLRMIDATASRERVTASCSSRSTLGLSNFAIA
mmetsp:Transcript_2038/g.6373  ORF Transcript_2038/g.6373 Transcript_2038/m.6373 type:complete len:262 (+) Transcript_2038:7432-8217(+)